jgi:Chalcone isomerase-like
MKNYFLLAFFVGVLSTTVSAQNMFEAKGVKVPRTLEFQGKTMELSGFGVRSKMWMDVYVQALYQSLYSDNAFEVMQSNTEMAIRIEITSALVSSGKLTRNFNNGFERSAGANLEALRPRIEKFKSYLSDQIVAKDVFNLIYNPLDASVYVYKNDVLKGTVPGLDFKMALFGIWLSNNPVDEQLKKDLLGIK